MQAYGQLAAEGWLAGRAGSATVVAFDAELHRGAAASREQRPTRWRFDLRPGRPDTSSFPRLEWLRALRRALVDASPDALGYGNPQGHVSLRRELAGYLGRARGLRVAPENLLVTTGFTQGLGLVARALAAAGVERVAMEEPSMPLHRAIVRGAGHHIALVHVDGEGARIEELERSRGAGAVVLTPNRQHPTGTTLSAERRARLLEWARATEAFVIEDDYDGEFRYDRHPIGPLQGLDPAVVVYGGTVSKTLAPGVRLGWLAVPDSLRAEVIRQKELADWHSSVLEQLALGELLRTGAYDRHVRKMRLQYRRRRDVLIRALAATTPALSPTGGEAGLDLLIPLESAKAEQRAIAAASAAGVGVGGLVADGYYERGGSAGLVVGYAAAPEHSFQRAVEAFVSALELTRPRSPGVS